MRVKATLKPGQRGTKKLLDEYGDRLVRVRYRYDARRKKQYKTAEIIVEESEWEPMPRRTTADAVVGIRVDYAEVALRDEVKRAGGRWNPVERVWELRYGQVVRLGLEERIVRGGGVEG